MELIEREALYTFLTDQLDKETGAYSKGRNAGIHVARSALHNKQITPTIDLPDGWISVKERLPEPGERVLATNGVVSGEAYLGDGWKRYYGVGWQTAFDLPVTHWMPLPEPPGEEENNARV